MRDVATEFVTELKARAKRELPLLPYDSMAQAQAAIDARNAKYSLVKVRNAAGSPSGYSCHVSVHRVLSHPDCSAQSRVAHMLQCCSRSKMYFEDLFNPRTRRKSPPAPAAAPSSGWAKQRRLPARLLRGA